MNTPIEPTKVFPAGAPLPAPRTAPWEPPPAPPAEPPAWRSAPPPSGPPAGGGPVDVHHYVHVTVSEPGPLLPLPEPRFDWSRLWTWIRTRHWIGFAVALAPLPNGQSLATGWGAALRQCREQQSIGGAYVLAVTALGVTLFVSRRRPSWWAATAAVVALFGLAAQASPYDLVTFVTGVTR